MTARPMGPLHPFEVCIFAAVAAIGLEILTGLGDSSSVSQALPPGMQMVWAFLYAAGGVVAMAGYVWPGSMWTGVEIKRVGLVMVFFGAAIYGLAAAMLGQRGVPTATLHLAVATACGWRVVQVRRRLIEARRPYERYAQSSDHPGGRGHDGG